MKLIIISRHPLFGVISSYSFNAAVKNFLRESFQTSTCPILQVRDGGYRGAPLLGNRYCGNSAPPPLTSSQNMMWIRYVTDGSDNSTEFQASYERADPCMCFSFKRLSQTD